jgi:fructose-bisphosphate aldolase class II
MALESMKNMLEKAELSSKLGNGAYAVPAFNINTELQAQSIFQAAYELKSPFIVQASKGACLFEGWVGNKKEDKIDTLLRGARRIRNIVDSVGKDYPDLKYALHLDHGESYDIAVACIKAGFSSVMIDGSELELDKNIELTRRVVDYIKSNGLDVSVEAELGTLGGKSHSGGLGKIEYTDPKHVVEFVRQTGVEALAICWGTRHGPNKFSDKDMDLRPEIIKQCYDALEENGLRSYLVSHGSSTVPKKYVEGINRHLGYIVTKGVPCDKVEQAIRNGVRKINIDTDLRLAMTSAVRKSLDDKRDCCDPRDYLVPAREAMYEAVKDTIIMFHSDSKL